jgi:hypothetical protein
MLSQFEKFSMRTELLLILAASCSVHGLYLGKAVNVLKLISSNLSLDKKASSIHSIMRTTAAIAIVTGFVQKGIAVT